MDKTLLYLIKAFLLRNKIAFNESELKLQLLSHPYFPSLQSVTDLLDHFDIENLAVELPKDEETFSQTPDTFLAHVNEGGERLVLVEKKNDALQITYQKDVTKQFSLSGFFKVWSGIVLLVEKKEKAEKRIIFKQGSKILLAFILVGIGAFFLMSHSSLFPIVHFILTGIGVVVCVLIVQHELGFYSKILDKFCSGESEKTSCDAVLRSKGASLFGKIKLGNVGLVYFLGIGLSWILLALSEKEGHSSIALMSILAFPVTLFSLYYQWKVVKKWCPLCLCVVFVLCLQFAVVFLSDLSAIFSLLNFSGYIILFASFVITALFWMYIYPLLKKVRQLENLEIAHYKIKRNYNLFKAALDKSPMIDTSVNAVKEIVLGAKNKEVPLEIVAVTSPVCFYCKGTHSTLGKLLEKSASGIQVVIRFNVPHKNKEDAGTQIATRLLELYDADEELCYKALHEAYGSVNANEWLLRWETTDTSAYESVLSQEQDWCYTHNINFTPAVFLNGRQMPKEYEVSDLLYLADELIEEQGGSM